MLLFIFTLIISYEPSYNIHTISFDSTKQQIARNVYDSVCFFIEKVEDVFLL